MGIGGLAYRQLGYTKLIPLEARLKYQLNQVLGLFFPPIFC